MEGLYSKLEEDHDELKDLLKDIRDKIITARNRTNRLQLRKTWTSLAEKARKGRNYSSPE